MSDERSAITDQPETPPAKAKRSRAKAKANGAAKPDVPDCPWCKVPLKVYHTRGRIRYCRCEECGLTKSYVRSLPGDERHAERKAEARRRLRQQRD